MKKIVFLAGFTAVVIGAVALAPSSVLAYKGDPTVKGPNYTPERHAAMVKAFEDNDYQAWKAQMEGRGITRRITEQNFAQFAQAHRLALAGKTAEAAAIRAELGLGQRGGAGMGQGNGQCQNSR